MLELFDINQNLPLWLLIIANIVSILMLAKGGDYLTQGASDIAFRLKINPIVIGLTIVSVATSMPELFTCLSASLKGSDDIALGNILGSNLGNMGLIMGVTAIMMPVVIPRRLIMWELPFLLGVTIVFFLLCAGGALERHEGILLLITMAAYLIVIIRYEKDDHSSDSEEPVSKSTVLDSQRSSLPKCVILIAIGGVLLFIGSDLLIDSSVATAKKFNVSEIIIGLTVVAIGTSLPELATCMVAVMRKESELIAGNIVGSNLFNTLFVSGAVSMYSGQLSVDHGLLLFEFPAMILLTGILWLFFITERTVTRVEGVLLVISYFAMISLAFFDRQGYL